jgi:hypothetical protein
MQLAFVVGLSTELIARSSEPTGTLPMRAFPQAGSRVFERLGAVDPLAPYSLGKTRRAPPWWEGALRLGARR